MTAPSRINRSGRMSVPRKTTGRSGEVMRRIPKPLATGGEIGRTLPNLGTRRPRRVFRGRVAGGPIGFADRLTKMPGWSPALPGVRASDPFSCACWTRLFPMDNPQFQPHPADLPSSTCTPGSSCSAATDCNRIPMTNALAPIIRLITPLVAAFVFAGLAPAQTTTTGGVTGTVSNTSTGHNLDGAEVTLTPGGVSTLTTRDGRFIFAQIAPGTYTLGVTYTGLDPKTIDVRVSPGATSTHDVGLSSTVYQLSKFVVEGDREGNALAITQQRNAANVKNVIAADAFGNIADLNLGNFLLRMPGVSKEESEGEIIRVRIRGVDANLNSLSIDGTRSSNGSTRDFNRGSEIDKVPADFIESIEITKAATPEMDADSIGGSVNLKTKSALDRKGRRTTYNFGHTFNIAQRSFRPLGSFSHSDNFLGQTLGVLVTGSYNESHKPRDRSNISYEATTATDRPVSFGPSSWGEDQLKHKRAGFGVRFDYKLTDATRVYLNTMRSQYYDQLNRRQAGIGLPSAANTRLVTNTITETANQTLSLNQNLRNRDINTVNYQFGGESRLGGGRLDFTANYSPSKGTEQRFIPTRTTAGLGFRFDRSESHNWLKATQISGPDLYDARNSLMTSLDTLDYVSRDRIAGAQLNFRKPLATPVPLALKTGARFRTQTREQDQNRRLYSYVGPNGVAGPAGAANDDNLDRFFDPGYTYVTFQYPRNLQWLKLPEYQAALRSSPQLFRENFDTNTRDTLRGDGKAGEDVTAAYVMAEAKLGRLVVVTGVRAEETNFTGRGYKQEVTPAERARRATITGTLTPEETVRRAVAEYFPTEGTGRYRDYFPSLHFKYNATKNLVGRASFSTGIGRPNFGQIIPTQSINNDTQTVTSNNPDLQPQYSRNLDAALEYYFEPAGLASVGVFQKDLRNFIFRSNVGVIAPGNEIGEAYNGYALTTDRNGGKAKIRGLEVSYNQQFSTFPGFLRAFGAFANFTWLQSTGDYGTPGAARTSRQLPNFTPRSGNVGLSYIAHGWTVRAKWNYTGDRLLSFNNDPAQRVYNTVSKPVDLNLAYAVNRRLSIYADAINIFNTPTNHEYTYIPDRKTRSDLYTTVIKFGVSGSF
ncbi:MAG: TonB-dependent receptor [Opitutus sp.]|nr:TonB-dependent receptor [Opitutus sp.]